jgi:hypothetical protein
VGKIACARSIRVGNRVRGDFAHADKRARLPTLQESYAKVAKLNPVPVPAGVR